MTRAIEEYRAAARLYSSFAAARLRQAYGYSVLLDWGWQHPTLTNDDLLAHALDIAADAIRLDSASADAWLARAYLLVIRDPVRARGALQAFQKAIALGPGSAEAFHQYGQTLMMLGRYDEADIAYRNALAIRARQGHDAGAAGGNRDASPSLRTRPRDRRQRGRRRPDRPLARAARGSYRIQAGDAAVL